MRLARARHGNRVVLVRLEGDTAVVVADESAHPAADVLREALANGTDLAGSGVQQVPADSLTLLAPVANPAKLLCVGLNYADHARESQMEAPPAPVLFAKTPNSIIGPGEPVAFRKGDTEQVDYEAELVVIIGRRTRDVAESEALDAVLGYTVGNDVSARDAQFADGQWLRGKSFDSFAPLGPVIATPEEIGDVQSLRVVCRVNGETLQDGSTKEMIHPVAKVIAYVSRFITLEPGDVIMTGTPDGVGFARKPPIFLTDGDDVEVEVERIGALRNPVRMLPADAG